MNDDKNSDENKKNETRRQSQLERAQETKIAQENFRQIKDRQTGAKRNQKSSKSR